jgi:prostaglandin-endoperoxide synthase 2
MFLSAGQRLRNRAVMFTYVTVVECAGLYAWLRLTLSGQATLGAACLVLEESLESGVLLAIFLKGPTRGVRDTPAVASHLQSAQAASAFAINAEILIWLIWFYLARKVAWLPAGLFLLISMHLKHQLEAATVLDTRFWKQFHNPIVVIGSFTEVAGGVASLQLLLAGHLVLGLVTLVAGISVEHILFIDAAQTEMEKRDICLPRRVDGKGKRSWVWRRRGVRYTIAFWLATHFSWYWWVIDKFSLTHGLSNSIIINQFVRSMEPRPARLSTLADYTSWASLTDRSYSDRHLPPRRSKSHLPEVDRVVELFARDGTGRASQKSTLLFPFFAQWFVDGFLRTDPDCARRNTSSHQIDLGQLYGRKPEYTEILRAPCGGKLKSERHGLAEFPPKYFDADGNTKPEFEGLPLLYPGGDPKAPNPGTDTPLSEHFDDTRRCELFALGLPRGNVYYGTALMSTLFLREHNRLAQELAEENHWDEECDNDKIFETARSVLIVKLLKIVVNEYINHITPFKFRVECLPGVGVKKTWFRPNWMSIEFDLLYRWHALVPDEIMVGGEKWAIRDLLWNTDVLIRTGLGPLVEEASTQRCMEIGLRNTAHLLLDVEKRAIQYGRDVNLAGYNDYRAACRYPRVSSFADISSEPDIQERLAACYGSADDVDLVVGLYAEDIDPGGVLGDLMGTMVGVDAFSQAFTNPLIDQRIFSEQTFTPVGMKEINDTNRLADIVKENVPEGAKPQTVTFELPARR